MCFGVYLVVAYWWGGAPPPLYMCFGVYLVVAYWWGGAPPPLYMCFGVYLLVTYWWGGVPPPLYMCFGVYLLVAYWWGGAPPSFVYVFWCLFGCCLLVGWGSPLLCICVLVFIWLLLIGGVGLPPPLYMCFGVYLVVAYWWGGAPPSFVYVFWCLFGCCLLVGWGSPLLCICVLVFIWLLLVGGVGLPPPLYMCFCVNLVVAYWWGGEEDL